MPHFIRQNLNPRQPMIATPDLFMSDGLVNYCIQKSLAVCTSKPPGNAATAAFQLLGLDDCSAGG